MVEDVLCILVDKNDKSKYVCFTQNKPEGTQIGLSNGEDVWQADLSEEMLSQLKKRFFLKSTEDYALKLKGACRNGTAFVSLQEESAVLHLGLEPADLTVPFSKLPDPERRTAIKDLLFNMADSVMHQNSTGNLLQAQPSSSPVKCLQKRSMAFEPRKPHSGPSVAVRKRLPGDSIINPGTRRKRAATGVDFEEDDV